MTFDVPAPAGDVEIAIFNVKGAKRSNAGSWASRGRYTLGHMDGPKRFGRARCERRLFCPDDGSSFTQTRKVVLLK